MRNENTGRPKVKVYRRLAEGRRIPGHVQLGAQLPDVAQLHVAIESGEWEEIEQLSPVKEDYLYGSVQIARHTYLIVLSDSSTSRRESSAGAGCHFVASTSRLELPMNTRSSRITVLFGSARWRRPQRMDKNRITLELKMIFMLYSLPPKHIYYFMYNCKLILLSWLVDG